MSLIEGMPMSNVYVLRNNGVAPTNADIAKHLREQADWIEEPDTSGIRQLIVVYEYEDGSMMRNTCGQPTDRVRIAGLLLHNAHLALHDKQSTTEDEPS